MSAVPKPQFYRMTLSAFLRTGFLGKPPSRNTVKRFIDGREWAGEKVGGTYFIFVDELGQPIRPTSATGNAAADALLNEWSQGR